VYDASMDATTVRARFLPAMELLPNVGLILVLGYGGHQVLNGSLSIGALVAFTAYIVLLIWPLRMLGMIIAAGQRASASAHRAHEVLSTDPIVVDPLHPTRLPHSVSGHEGLGGPWRAGPPTSRPAGRAGGIGRSRGRDRKWEVDDCASGAALL
jgi:ABC-type multidrug transport system fused ATPase/permease subunit